jgi:hypothetical protein
MQAESRLEFAEAVVSCCKQIDELAAVKDLFFFFLF